MRIFDLKLNEQQLNIVGAALGQLPYAQVAPTINAINAQIQAQMAPAETPADTPAGGSQ